MLLLLRASGLDEVLNDPGKVEGSSRHSGPGDLTVGYMREDEGEEKEPCFCLVRGYLNLG